jgi:hypothetical protein
LKLRHARAPSRRTSTAPATEIAISSANVSQPPIRSPTLEDQDQLDDRDDKEHEQQPAGISLLARCRRGLRGQRVRAAGRPRRERTAHHVTRHSASATIARLILLSPRSRSMKVIGTSTMWKPRRQVCQARSTWKQ